MLFLNEQGRPHMAILLLGTFDSTLSLSRRDISTAGNECHLNFRHFHAVCYLDSERTRVLGGAIIASSFKNRTEGQMICNQLALEQLIDVVPDFDGEVMVVCSEIKDPTRLSLDQYDAFLSGELSRLALEHLGLQESDTHIN